MAVCTTQPDPAPFGVNPTLHSDQVQIGPGLYNRVPRRQDEISTLPTVYHSDGGSAVRQHRQTMTR